ncbi:MAG: carboxymuconolactone decarboxylase family protein, partial [Pseudonocardia sp.]
CPYCVNVHTTMLRALGDRAAADAAGTTAPVPHPEQRTLLAWARSNRRPAAPVLRQPPFSDTEAPEIIGVALTYHYINRMVNVFAAPSPFPGSAAVTATLSRRAAQPLLRRLLARSPRPGDSLDLLPAAPLPEDLRWAHGVPVLAEAFARAAAAFDTAGRQSLPDSVRDLVASRLQAWRGEDLGISRAWAEDLVSALPTAQRPLGRLALLTALASHQVDARIIQDARPGPGPDGDRILLAATGWASFTAARRIGTWLDPAAPA